jgi:hypothetical protein
LKTDRLGLKPTTKVAGINHKTCYVLGVMLISQAVNLGAGVPTPAALGSMPRHHLLSEALDPSL